VPPCDRQLLPPLPPTLPSSLLTFPSWTAAMMTPISMRVTTIPAMNATNVVAFRVWRQYLSSSGSKALSAAVMQPADGFRRTRLRSCRSEEGG